MLCIQPLPKPKLIVAKKCVLGKNCINLFFIIFSNILENFDNSEIGRKLLKSVLESPLWMGIATTVLNFEGKTFKTEINQV